MYKREINTLSPLESKILNILKDQNGKPIPINILFKKLNYGNRSAVYSAIDYLTDNFFIEKLNNGKLILGYTNGKILDGQTFVGTIIINGKADAFFKIKDEKESFAYINKKNLNSALNNDTVEICLMDKNTYPDLQDAVVTKIIERDRDFFTGTYYLKPTRNKFKKGIELIVPDDKKINLKIELDDSSDLVNGNKVLFKIARISDGVIYCSVSKILGHIDDVGNDIISIVYDNNIDPEFDEETKEETSKIDFGFSQEEDAKRKDLSHINFVTIDPATSKDMDDAVCVVKNKDGTYKLYVAIADVSYYVKLHSNLWRSALKRGTSIYLVNQVIPMLPHKLSNNICSLNPFEKRYAQVCEMDIDKNGEFTNIQVYPAIIFSKYKFAYDNVNDYIKLKKKIEEVPDEIYEMLNTSFELDDYLNKKREKDGYINFDIKEAKIILDENEKIKDVVIRETGPAQKMIENFMVAANEAVTLKFHQLCPNLPFVYRVHAKPEEKRINDFKIEADKIGFIYDRNLTSWKPNTVSKWLEKNKNNPNKDLINMILLRTMAKAKYQTANLGHFGLSISNYTHFTSPIRRLADVIVHYLLRMFVYEPENYSEQEKDYILCNLDDFCLKANSCEVLAVETERDVNAMKFAEYMKEKIGCEYNGFVSYITNFGVFVQLENTIEGLVKPMFIKDDYYVFNQKDLTYVGRNKNRVISLGQKVKIRVVDANKETKKIDFEIIGYLN
ncbi:ribonuclease R [Malacoplasma penetrans]|uniref:Ribonuclease R n=1 Tax=Malacoplasma penetrans (strain HF-2) TaxID=272633 RepID=Q8EW72_MALP2|nr:ribonuclease R [Malacoplasma penetrans]RXY96623.1 ribonuclease R [Malacoplasma penetrans]BAC44124.1 3'-5' exoribonuclease RNase R [Malacoplasma penetrans HF-2]